KCRGCIELSSKLNHGSLKSLWKEDDFFNEWLTCQFGCPMPHRHKPQIFLINESWLICTPKLCRLLHQQGDALTLRTVALGNIRTRRALTKVLRHSEATHPDLCVKKESCALQKFQPIIDLDERSRMEIREAQFELRTIGFFRSSFMLYFAPFIHHGFPYCAPALALALAVISSTYNMKLIEPSFSCLVIVVFSSTTFRFFRSVVQTRRKQQEDSQKSGSEDLSGSFERSSHFYERGERTETSASGYIRRGGSSSASGAYHSAESLSRSRARDRLYRNGPYTPLIER
ncbi:unnamed protein product, partial [Nesidiocoris tenuis]